nr:hypothetical protein [uncultured Campylobacter sp.]
MTRIYAWRARKWTRFAGAKFYKSRGEAAVFKTPILKVRRIVNLARKTRCALNLRDYFAGQVARMRLLAVKFDSMD